MAHLPPQSFTLRDGARITIRTAEPADAPGILALDQIVAATTPFNVEHPDERTRDVPKQEERIRDHLEDPGALYLLAVSPSSPHLIGTLNFKAMKPSRMRHHGHFGIGLHPDWRSRGLGRFMLQTLIDWARSHAFIERLDLGVFAENAHAIALYQSLGFTEVCRRIREFRYAPDHYIDDIQMSLWVK